MQRFRGCRPSWYLLKVWKSVFSLRADSILKSDGGLYNRTESFLTVWISLVHELDKP